MTATALRSVADRRFYDAVALGNTQDNERANGAMYLAGFTIECLLKAQMLKEYPWLSTTKNPNSLSTKDERRIWELCYRSHDLDEIYARLPQLQKRINSHEQIHGPKLSQHIRQICSTWTIFARYSPLSANIREAISFLEIVRALRKHLQ